MGLLGTLFPMAPPNENAGPRLRLVVCTACGYHGQPDEQGPGVLLGVALLLFYVIPGLLYFWWRSTRMKPACPLCGSTLVIPEESPLARKFLAETASP